MNNIDDNEQAGLSFLSVLGIVFIVLKLTGTISWSWWWVLAPFWTPFAISLVVFTVTTVVYFINERKQ